MKTAAIRLPGYPQIATLLAIAGLIIAPVSAQAATTYYVATNGSDTVGTLGTTWTNAFLTISNGVRYAIDDDTILVSNGLYVISAQIAVTNGIAIRSWNNGVLDRANTIVKRSGTAMHRIFYLSNSAALVEGFTITNGQLTASSSGGAGVHIAGGTLRNCTVANNVATNTWGDVGGIMVDQTGLVDNCEIVANSGWRAGGVYLFAGGLVSNCTIVNNTNTYTAAVNGSGGGIRIIAGGTAADCVVMGNFANANGGGFYVQTGTVHNCRVIGNESVGNGGGVSLYYGYIRNSIIQSNRCMAAAGAGMIIGTGGTAENCRVEGNLGNRGAGLYSTSTARNCLITGNTATNSGGGGAQLGGLMENCTVASNTCASATGGGGLYIDYRNYWTTFVNTIIYGNTSLAGTASNYYHQPGTINPGGGYVYSNCCVAPLPAQQTNSTANDPLYANTGYNDFSLQRGSPCINTGLNQDWMTNAVNIDGHGRLDRFTGLVDMGCYEYVGPGTMFSAH